MLAARCRRSTRNCAGRSVGSFPPSSSSVASRKNRFVTEPGTSTTPRWYVERMSRASCTRRSTRCPQDLNHWPATDTAYAKALAETLKTALSFLTIRQYTKHIDPDVASDADTMHMLWDTEVATAGAQWVHFFSIHPTATDLARSCASAIMDEFQRHPYLAAANAKGHGLVAFDGYAPANGAEPLPSSALVLGRT